MRVCLPLCLAVAMAAGGQEEVIDFEQAAPGADAFDLYQDRGVRLSTHPTIFETAGARSGRHVLRSVGPGGAAPSRWVTIELAEEIDVRRIAFFVGVGDAAADEQVRVVVDGMTPAPLAPEMPAIRLPSSFDQQVRTIAAGPLPGSTPIATRFELSRKPGESPITQVRITAFPPGRVILIDDLSFEAGSPKPRAAGMQGGCEAYGWDMSREMAAWERAGAALASLADASSPADPLPLGRRVDLALRPVEKVRLAAPPEKAPAGPYAGVVALAVPADGVYRVSAGSRVWIDVVEAGRRVPSAKFEGHAGCAKIHKSVAFPLKAGPSYRLQLSGSDQATASVLVTPEP